MISFIVGRPRGGKSYFAVTRICETLAKTERGVVISANMGVKLDELAEYCHQYIDKSVDISKRVMVLPDSCIREFWLYDPWIDFEYVYTDLEFTDPKTGTVTKCRYLEGIKGGKTLDRMSHPEKEGKTVPDLRQRQLYSPGVDYFMDEAHLIFSARAWQSVSVDAEFYFSQHGKMRCDIWLITQHPEKVDKNMRRNAQDYYFFRNLQNEKFFWGIRGIKTFRWAQYLEVPSPGQKPQETGFIKCDVNRYGKLYDTSAGVGLVGRIHTEESVRGKSPFWLVPIILAIVLGAVFLPRMVFGFAGHLVGSSVTSFTKGVSDKVVGASGLKTVRPSMQQTNVAPQMASGALELVQRPVQLPATNEVFCVGVSRLAGLYTVYLSNGKVCRESRTCAIFVIDDQVTVGKQVYSLKAMTNSVSVVRGPGPLGEVSTVREVRMQPGVRDVHVFGY